MSAALRLIYTTCPTGQEAAFEEWYRRVHLPDILSVEGFLSGRLLKLSGAGPAMQTEVGLVVAQYLAVYETNTIDADGLLDRLRAAAFRAQGRGFAGMQVVSRATYTPLTGQLTGTWMPSAEQFAQ